MALKLTPIEQPAQSSRIKLTPISQPQSSKLKLTPINGKNTFESGGNIFERVGKKISTGFQNLVNEPADKLTIPGDIARLAVDAKKGITEGIPDLLERTKTVRDPNVAFPLTSGIAPNIPVADKLIPITRASFRKFGPIGGTLTAPDTLAMDIIGTGASVGYDVIGNIYDAAIAKFRPTRFGAAGGKGADFPERFKAERLGTFGTLGESEIRKVLPEAQEKFRIAVEENDVDPTDAATGMFLELAARGMAVDVASEAFINALFLGQGYATRQAERLSRFNRAMSVRHAQRAERAQQALVEISGKYKALPAPGPRPLGGRPVNPAQPQPAPIAGPGFVMDQPGFALGPQQPHIVKPTPGFSIKDKRIAGSIEDRQPGFSVKSPQPVENIIEKSAREAPLEVREIVAPRPSGKVIDIKGEVVEPKAPSRAVRLSDAARAARVASAEEQAIINRASVLQEKNFPELQAKALPGPKGAGAAPLPVERGTIAGKGFIVEPTPSPLSIIKKPFVRENIIEKAARETQPLQERPKAIKKAGQAARKEFRQGIKKIRKEAAEESLKGNLPSSVPNVLKGQKKGLGKRGSTQAFGEGGDSKKGVPTVLRTSEIITRKDLRNNPDRVYLFGDNTQQRGFGGQAAEMRGEPNAIGIPTKKKPTMNEDAFFTDAEFEANKKAIDAAFNKIPKGKSVVVPPLGEGRAQLRQRAPKTYAYLQKRLDELDVTSPQQGLGEKGFAKAFGDGPPRKVSDAEKEARLRRFEAKVAGKIDPGTQPTVGNIADGKTTGKVTIKRKKADGKGTEKIDVGKDIEIELPETVVTTDSLGRQITKEVGGTKVGSIKVGEMVKKGELTEREARMLIVAERINPSATKQFETVTRADRAAEINNPKIKRFLKELDESDPREFAALHDTPINQAIAYMKEANRRGLSIAETMDEVAQEINLTNKVANVLGVNLNAIRDSIAKNKLIQMLEDKLGDKGLSGLDRKLIQAQLDRIRNVRQRSKVLKALDMVTEFGINAMLSSPVTFTRNLVGSTLGLSFQIPNKIGQTLISNIAHVVGIPQEERVFFREIGPEIVGMVNGLVRGLRKGKRFLKHEDVRRVYKHIDDRIKDVKSKHIPKGMAYSQLKRDQKARILRELREDLRDLLTEEEFTRAAELGFPESTRSIPGKLGKIINTPVRLLVGTDKVFQSASAGGHIAAKRIRKAIQQGTSVKDIRLTRSEIEEAKNDSLFYVFRESLGDGFFSKFQNAISSTPLLPLVIPFFKSRINFMKFALKQSPFGLVRSIKRTLPTDTAPKGKLVLNTKAVGRAMSGTAVLMGLDYLLEKNKDTMEVHPAAASTAERELRRESGLGEQVVVFGKHLTDPKRRKVTHVEPYGNLAPASAAFEVIGLKQEIYRRLAKGEPESKALGVAFQKAVKGVLNSQFLGGVRDTVRAIENAADKEVALDADGKPEKGFVKGLLEGPFGEVVTRRTAGVAIPNLVRDVTKVMDKRIFDPEGFGQTVLADLPVPKELKKDIPVRQTMFGEDAKRQQARIPFNPFFKRKEIDRTMEEMLRLDILPTKTPRKLSKDKLKIVLTEDERRRFNFLGKELKFVLDEVTTMPLYTELPDVARGKMLEKIIDNFREKQGKVIKTEALLRLIQSDEGIAQMMEGVTKGRSF